MLSKKLHEKCAKVQWQIDFCGELMKRINDGFMEKVSNATTYKDYEYKMLDGRNQLANEVIRLRRELNTLREMLEKLGWDQ